MRSRDERFKKFNEILNNKIIVVGSKIYFPEGLNGVDSFVNHLSANGYFDVPAGLRHHGTRSGDLFEHSLKVAEILDDYTQKLRLVWSRSCSPWIIGLFHDLCKMDDYVRCDFNDILVDPQNANLDGWGFNPRRLLTGHGDKSVMMLSRFMTLTEEEIMCIRYHMGAYNTDEWKQYDLAIRKYPNVLYTHTADMLASKVYKI